MLRHKLIEQIRNYALISLMVFSQSIWADGTGISMDFGSAGTGLELSTGINKDFDARIGFHSSKSSDYTMVDPTRFVETSNERNEIALLGDWHPFENEFRTTLGLIYYSANHKQLKSSTISQITTTTKKDPMLDFVSLLYELASFGLIKIKPETETKTTSTWADFGTHTYDVRYRTLAPYIGIGYGSPVIKKSGFGLKADVGVFYRGSPSVNSSFTCGTSNPVGSPMCSAYQNELAIQEAAMKTNFPKWMPRVAVGLTYDF